MPKNTNIKRVTLIVVLLMSLVEVSSQVRKAFLVGISDYNKSVEVSKSDNEWGNIHGANDIMLLTPTLKKQEFKITTLVNKSATADNIRKGLKSFSSGCQPNDIVYIHFSCHGQPVEDMNGDEEDGWDEALIPVDAKKVYQKGKYEGKNHITDDELNGYLKSIRSKIGPKGFVYVVLDACHAGGSSRGEDENDDDGELFVRGTKKGFSSQRKDYRPRINAKGHFQIPHEAGLADITILEACRSYESNYEIKQLGKYYGPLSYYVNQVLTTHQLSCSNDWVLEVRNLMNSDKRLTRQNMVYETSLK